MPAIQEDTCQRELERSDETTTSTIYHIILFYKYVSLESSSSEAENQLELCTHLNLCGRVLISQEGINATLAGNLENINHYIEQMQKHSVFRLEESDFKRSTSSSAEPPFSGRIVKVVKEIVSTGGLIPMPKATSVNENKSRGYLSPQEFHQAVVNSSVDDTVILDVRSHKEYLVGHFENALDPEVKTFSEYSSYLDKKLPVLENKKVLMYCTGGIRCEKASDYLRSKGIQDVSHLKGGIHKYLEAFPTGGSYKGKNFVFDKRVLMEADDSEIVGSCIECHAPYDQFSGDRICTVCRDLVLVCDLCRKQLDEFHCDDHQHLKHCYFTNLQYYTIETLELQRVQLQQIHASIAVGRKFKNRRKTLQRQIQKILQRIQDLKLQKCQVEENQGFLCRTCNHIDCKGLCWGFWQNEDPHAIQT